MSQQSDLLEEVVLELETRTGQLAAVARAAGLSYDTVLRIKNREGDPGYAKVRALANYLFATESAPTQPELIDTEAAPPVPEQMVAARDAA